jgi:hypothetical protein
MKSKHEEMKEDDLFYCFVDLGPEHPNVYVVPSKKVAEVIADAHQTWLATPGRGGKQHNDTDMRRIITKYNMELKSAPEGWMDEYLENWDLLLQ